jgi:hypothetical protein
MATTMFCALTLNPKKIEKFSAFIFFSSQNYFPPQVLIMLLEWCLSGEKMILA